MDDMVVKDAKEKLGDDYDECVKRDWKVTEVPEDYNERLGKDGRALNPKSLKNLVQYRKRTKKEKEAALAQLRFTEKKKDKPKQSYEPDPKESKLLSGLKNILPIDDFFHEDEIPVFFQMIDFYLQDFEEGDLSANDIDDLIAIAQNRILEIRLLKHGKSKTSAQIDTAQAIEKLRKQTEKAKENLLVRRKDRLAGKDVHSFTIVDLVAAYENDKKLRLTERVDKLVAEEQDILNNRGDIGNRDDPDAKILEYDFENE
jgi:hypothetical protein